MNSLSFQNTQFEIVDRNGSPWLKSGQLAIALGYADQSSINRIYARNQDEFNDSMTASVKLTDPSGYKQETRIFSLRGCHLIAMLSKTEVAKSFRKWVLDILDSDQSKIHQYITEAEAQIFRKSMEHHCKHSSDKYGELYRRVYDHFGITTYKHIPAGKLGEAANIIGIKLVGLSIPRLPAKAKKLPKPEFVKPEVDSVVHVEQVRREFAAYDSFLFNFGLEVIWVLDETDPEKLVKNASRNYHGSNIGVKLDILRSQLRMWLKMVDDAEVINQAALAYAMDK